MADNHRKMMMIGELPDAMENVNRIIDDVSVNSIIMDPKYAQKKPKKRNNFVQGTD